MKLRPFELALIAIFGALGLIALALLSTYKPNPDTTAVSLGSSVTIWGTVDKNAFQQMLRPLVEATPAYSVVSYEQKDPSTFDDELLNALADGIGPDILFLSHEQLVQYRTKIQPFSYTQFPLPDFQNRYIDGTEIFAMNDGVYAFPAVVDPLVMYWNRDILSTYNFITPPATWETVVNETVPTLVKRDFDKTIIRSPLAFGEYRNVTNGFGIISMLLLQGGSKLVMEENNTYKLYLNQSRSGAGLPFESAVTFYTNFASPSNPLYSWNRAQPNDRLQFLSEDLVLYFGKGSEASSLATQNPNLNFAMAEVPQGAIATIRWTYGTFYGYALLRSSRNSAGAQIVMQVLGSVTNVEALANALQMAPTYRSSLSTGSNDQYGRIIYSSATVARGWLSPKPTITNDIFTQMVEDVLANRHRPGEAANDAVGRLREVY